jgi:hypothetical protein
MDRRDLLRWLGGLGTVGLAGCYGADSDERLAVEGSAPTLRPGTEAVLVATVSNADRVSFSQPDREGIRATGADVSPSPDMQFDSFPPGWVWDVPQSSIEATLGVSVRSDADADEYTYGVSAANGETELDATFTITVGTA